MNAQKPMPPGIKRSLVGSALVTLGAPMLGVAGTVLGMIGSFAELGRAGVADMSGLSSSISLCLISTGAGLFVGAAGLFTFLAVLIYWLSREEPSRPL